MMHHSFMDVIIRIIITITVPPAVDHAGQQAPDGGIRRPAEPGRILTVRTSVHKLLDGLVIGDLVGLALLL